MQTMGASDEETKEQSGVAPTAMDANPTDKPQRLQSYYFKEKVK